MRWILLISLFSAYVTTLFAQDAVFLKEGVELNGKVLRVTDSGVLLDTGDSTRLVESSLVFLIMYEDGGILNLAGNSNKRTRETKSEEQTRKLGRYKRDSLAVIFADGVLFHGFDFSFVRLVNPAKVGTEANANRYFGEWNAHLREKLRVGKEIRKTWESYRITENFDPLRRPEKWIFESESKDIPINQYLRAIQDYSLTESEKQFYDVALVVFPIVLNKQTEEVQCRFVFYDPKRLDILWAPIAYGKTGCCGMTGHWAEGIQGSVRNMTKFIRAVNGRGY